MSFTLNAQTAPEVSMKLTTAQRERYRSLRKIDTPAETAYEVAARSTPLGLPFSTPVIRDNGAARTIMRRGPFVVVATAEWSPYDMNKREVGTLYQSGEFPAMSRKEPDLIRVDRKGTHFRPATSYWGHRSALSAMGMSKGVASELATQWTREDLNDYLDCIRYTVTVSVFVADVELARDAAGDIPLERNNLGQSLIDWIVDSDMVSDVLVDARLKLDQLQTITIPDFSSTEGDTALPGGK